MIVKATKRRKAPKRAEKVTPPPIVEPLIKGEEVLIPAEEMNSYTPQYKIVSTENSLELQEEDSDKIFE